MFSLEEEAEAMTDKEANDLLAKFKDADQIAAWARKYVAYAVKNEIIVGRPDGNFAPQDNLLGREYSKMLLAMLGYVQGVDFEYEFSTSEFADVAGFPKSEAVKLDSPSSEMMLLECHSLHYRLNTLQAPMQAKQLSK